MDQMKQSAVGLVAMGLFLLMLATPADEYGLLRNIADAPKVEPLQRWALDLYTLRQRNFLKDDPMFLYCKPPVSHPLYGWPRAVRPAQRRCR